MYRLGRISFRAIKTKRDYLGKRKAASWMYMSRLAAQKEFAFLKVRFSRTLPALQASSFVLQDRRAFAPAGILINRLFTHTASPYPSQSIRPGTASSCSSSTRTHSEPSSPFQSLESCTRN